MTSGITRVLLSLFLLLLTFSFSFFLSLFSFEESEKRLALHPSYVFFIFLHFPSYNRWEMEVLGRWLSIFYSYF